MADITTLVPDPLNSDRHYYRFYHYDIASMPLNDLLDELYAINSQVWFVKSDRFAYRFGTFEQRRRLQWLRERRSRIQAELSKRRYAIPQDSRHPKPKTRLSQGVRI